MTHTFDFLVVDDDADTRELMAIVLTSLGHRVTLARHGQELLELVHTQGHRFDLAAIDMQMPVMDGIEAASRLRAHPATRDLPILCISSRAGQAVREQCVALGCDAFLTKPCWEEDILAAMSGVLRAHGLLGPDESLA